MFGIGERKVVYNYMYTTENLLQVAVAAAQR